MSIYSWPVSLLKDLERWIKNFIWSGDIDQRKLVTVSWKKVCRPYSQGGLGIRSLISLNEATNLKLCWDMLQSKEQWAVLLRSRAIRNRSGITYHIFSSLWSSVKSELQVVMNNSNFIIGNGTSLNFWTDCWCGDQSIAQILQIPDNGLQNFNTKVSDYIFHNQWNLPPELVALFPNLSQLVEHVVIPIDQKTDRLVWRNSDSGDLSLKQAYCFKAHHYPSLHWASIIWSPDIPPSKSLLAWRLMNGKLPTDENLKTRGCCLPSVCSLCHKQEESSFHLFFDCPYAVNIWTWFSEIIGIRLHFNAVEDIWLLYDRNWQAQCRVVILACLINILHTIWWVRNQARFKNKQIQWRNAINIICSSVSLSGNLTKKTYHGSMTDFRILKFFKVSLHPPRAPVIKEVLWQPPPLNWLKCNTDGASNNVSSACGGVFRNHLAEFVVGFAENIGHHSSLIAELCGIMRAIEMAKHHNWNNLWLETDSSLAVLAFKNSSMVPWVIRNRWDNCMVLTGSMNIIATHIFREGNESADALANVGLSLNDILYYWVIPSCIISSVHKNKLGMSSFRFSCF
jgi:ribonuclease HI